MDELVSATLKELGYEWRTNLGKGVVEYEVVSPCNFLVRVEDLATERMGFGIRSRVKIESALEIFKTVGSKDPVPEVRKRVSEFLITLRKAMKVEPWSGLGIIGTRVERANWEKLGEI